MTYQQIKDLIIQNGLTKIFVNLQKYKQGGVTYWFCGYKTGRKYAEQTERYKSPREAILALKKV